MAQFDSPVTKYYLERCIGLVERLITNVEPLPSGADLVGSIQNDLSIPTSASELPTTGVLGLCVNLITIVSQDEEDPIELLLTTLSDRGVESICFPGAYERESKRQTERDSVPSRSFGPSLPGQSARPSIESDERIAADKGIAASDCK
jgi:hypothetical protein